ncbi:MAG: HD domain-containing protein [Lachnospiraceae bacterium]|nr:HD domain-containing protein [Lachnospiraceae bacterium]
MGKMKIKAVKPGMQLEQSVYQPGTDTCLLKAGTILSNRNLDQLKEIGIEMVDISDPHTVLITPMDKMEESLVEDFIHVLREISPLQAEANKSDQVVEVARKLEHLIRKIARNEEVLKTMVELRIIHKARLYDHAIYTAVLSGIVAGCMNLSNEEILVVLISALLHNMGVAEMPNLVRLDERNQAEEKLWQEHPTYGYYFALQKNIPRPIAACIQAHHEKYNGSGYPRGIKGDEIPVGARIIGVCQRYAAAITYMNIQPYLAVEELYGASGIYYDPQVVNTFVNNIPIYPLGVMVRLSTKEVGIVSNIRQNDGPRPLVKIYYNRVNRSVTEERIVDLGTERTIFIEEIL